MADLTAATFDKRLQYGIGRGCHSAFSFQGLKWQRDLALSAMRCKLAVTINFRAITRNQDM
jgi:hypothetical protein